MKTLISFLKQNGIANTKTFQYAAYKLAAKLQPVQKKNEGIRLSNDFGDITPYGLVVVQKPTFTLITVGFGDVKGVSISDFVHFLRNLNSIEVGNLKSGFDFPIEFCGILPLGYFQYLRKDKDFHFKILAEWAKQGLTNKELINLMKGYLSARVNWKWEFYKEIPKYLNPIYPKYLFKELSEATSNAEFDKRAKKWGLDELCEFSHPRKTSYSKLIYKLK